MSYEVLVGLDVGSTNIKAVATSTDGVELCVAHSPTPWQSHPQGQADMSALALSNAVLDLLSRCAGQLQDRFGEVVVTGLGVSGMAESGVLIDSGGTVATPIVAWFDPRGQDEITSSPEDFRTEFRGRTGLPVNSLATIAKLLHFQSQGIRLSAYRWLNVPEYIVHLLGGSQVTEYSLASRTGLMDQDNSGPFGAALSLLGVDERFLPPLIRAGDSAGSVTMAGLPQAITGAKLTVAGHDHLVAAVAAGAVRSDQIYSSMGTAEAMVRILDTPLGFAARERLALKGINALHHVVPGKYALLAGTKSGLIMRRVLQLVNASDPQSRTDLDEAVIQLPVDGGAAGHAVSVSGAQNDDGVLRIDINGDGVSPAEFFAACLRHGNDMCSELLECWNREVPAASSTVLTGGWARMKSVRRARSQILPNVSYYQQGEATGFGAAIFAGFTAQGGSAAGHDFGTYARDFCESKQLTTST